MHAGSTAFCARQTEDHSCLQIPEVELNKGGHKARHKQCFSLVSLQGVVAESCRTLVDNIILTEARIFGFGDWRGGNCSAHASKIVIQDTSLCNQQLNTQNEEDYISRDTTVAVYSLSHIPTRNFTRSPSLVPMPPIFLNLSTQASQETLWSSFANTNNRQGRGHYRIVFQKPKETEHRWSAGAVKSTV